MNDYYTVQATPTNNTKLLIDNHEETLN